MKLEHVSSSISKRIVTDESLFRRERSLLASSNRGRKFAFIVELLQT
jgi:hypothetical protein